MPRKKSATAIARDATNTVDNATRKVLDLSDSDYDTAPESNKRRKLNGLKDNADDNDNEPTFKINEEYAKRFEHNKKREDLHRLEEKYGKTALKGSDDSGSEDSGDDSSSEDEDEAGNLATLELDAQIQATLAAIRSKDPKVYDTKTTFFTAPEDEDTPDVKEKKEKSMTLKQYHQKNLLEGYTGEDEGDNLGAKTYVQEQEDLKRNVVQAMHNAGEASDDDDEEGFLVRKPGSESFLETDKTSTAVASLPATTVNPEKDPDGFLNAFLNERAWVPKDASGNAVFESEDSEEEDAAEEFEHMYNMRFEDPTLASRSKIVSHARDVTNKLSLRREEKSKRKKERDEKADKKQKEKEEAEADLKRLRKLQIEEVERKLKLVREAGGLELSDHEDVAEETEAVEASEKKRRKVEKEWQKFLEHDFGDDEWDEKMGNMYNDSYYGKKEDSKKVKKPTWDDDIDINDIVPDFKADASVSEDDDVEEAGATSTTEDISMTDVPAPETAGKPKKSKQKAPNPDRQTTRLIHSKIESYVDDNLPLSTASSSSRFRYRQVTPDSFHLTPTDILFAPDKQLNQYMGLKKLAPFRDDGKKLKDKKRYNKGKGFKAREWRKEVFGKPEVAWEDMVKKRTGADQKQDIEGEADDGGVKRDGGKKKNKEKKSKVVIEEKGGPNEAVANVAKENEGEKKKKKRRRKQKAAKSGEMLENDEESS